MSTPKRRITTESSAIPVAGSVIVARGVIVVFELEDELEVVGETTLFVLVVGVGVLVATVIFDPPVPPVFI